MPLRTGAALVAALAGTSAALARDVVKVDWTYTETEIAPQQGTYANRVGTVFIIDGRRITDGNNTTALPGQVRRGTSAYDVGYSVRYAVSHDHISKTMHTGGANIRVDVAFLPTGGCEATVAYFKNPGKMYFETRRRNNHERMVESDQHAEDVSCTVTAG